MPRLTSGKVFLMWLKYCIRTGSGRVSTISTFVMDRIPGSGADLEFARRPCQARVVPAYNWQPEEHRMNKPERIPQAATEEFLVGGVRMPRPFRIRRLGHFGVNVADPERSKDFFCRLLGFRISDPIDFSERVPQEQRDKVGPTVGYFSRHGTDHHSFVGARSRRSGPARARRPAR